MTKQKPVIDATALQQVAERFSALDTVGDVVELTARDGQVGERRMRLFTFDPLAEPESWGVLAGGDMDENDQARTPLLEALLQHSPVTATAHPVGDLDGVLRVYFHDPDGERLFASVVVSERRLHSMLREATFVLEGFCLQVAQAWTLEGLRAALQTWAGRNFPALDMPLFDVSLPEEVFPAPSGLGRRAMTREEAAEHNPDMLFADGLDDALVGVARRCAQQTLAVYDYELCVEVFMREGMSHEEAEEWMEFNVVGAWMGEQTPLFLVRSDEPAE